MVRAWKVVAVMALCPFAVAVMAPSFVSSRAVVGVIEQVGCDRGFRGLRPFFVHDEHGWGALLDSAQIARAVPGVLDWTVALHGRSLGVIRTADPRSTKDFPWDYVGNRGLVMDSATPAPRVANEDPTAFWSGCEGVRKLRPLVAVAGGPVADPDGWREFTAGDSARKAVYPEFRMKYGNLMYCPAGTNSAVALDYSWRDLKVENGVRNKRGDAMIALKLDVPRSEGCSKPTPGGGWNWFAMEAKPRFIGLGLEFIDAGDYDGDGTSELVFTSCGADSVDDGDEDNCDGVSLFSDHLRKRVNNNWTHH